MQLFYFAYLTILATSTALDNGLARTPPMGWLSWLFNYCEIDCDHHPKKCLSENLIMRIADRMAADGYREAGYEYIIIDDCWVQGRENGKMVADKKRFKNGIRALSDYVHSKGLKFGMYQDIGNKTCQGAPGMKGHEEIDARTFAAEWQIDYLKVDGCYASPSDMPKDYPKFGEILNKTGRPIVYSCSWPAYTDNNNYTEIGKYCNLWRNYGDISADWSSLSDIMNWFGSQPHLADTAGPGYFHDPDMLVAGHTKVSKDQVRVQMAVWSILAAPLMMSTDLDTIKDEYKEILLNKDVIRVNQCKMGKMGKRIYHKNKLQIWKRLYCQGAAIAMINMDKKAINYTFTREDLQLDDVDYKVSDLFKEDCDQTLVRDRNLTIQINPTGVKFYRFSLKGHKSANECK